MLAFALLALAAGAGLGAIGPGTPALLFSRVLEGLGFMGSRCPLPPPSRRRRGRHRRFALGLWGIYMPLGQFVAILLGPSIIDAVGWRGLWAVNADCCSGARAGGRGGASRGRVPAASAGAKRAPVWRNPAAVLIAVAFGTYSLQYLAVIGFLPTVYASGGWADTSAAISPRSSSSATSSATSFPECCCTGRTPRHADRGGRDVDGPGCRPRLCRWSPFGLSYGAAIAFALLGGLLPAAVFAAVPSAARGPREIGPVTGWWCRCRTSGRSWDRRPSRSSPPASGAGP